MLPITPTHIFSKTSDMPENSLAISRVEHAVVKVLIVNNPSIVSSPHWEIVRLSTTTEDGKTEDEHNDLGSSVQGCRHQVVVLDEDVGLVFAQVELGEEADGEVTEDRGVDANE